MPPQVDRPSWLARPAIFLVRVYQVVFSPLKHLLLGPHAGCRFHPTCSEYARVSLKRFGLFRGSWMAFRRVLRCHPFHPGGEDPVPEKHTCNDHFHQDEVMKR